MSVKAQTLGLVCDSAAELHFSAPTSCCLSLLQGTRVQRDPGDQDHRGGKKKPLVLEIVFTFLIDGRQASQQHRETGCTYTPHFLNVFSRGLFSF